MDLIDFSKEYVYNCINKSLPYKMPRPKPMGEPISQTRKMVTWKLFLSCSCEVGWMDVLYGFT